MLNFCDTGGENLGLVGLESRRDDPISEQIDPQDEDEFRRRRRDSPNG